MWHSRGSIPKARERRLQLPQRASFRRERRVRQTLGWIILWAGAIVSMPFVVLGDGAFQPSSASSDGAVSSLGLLPGQGVLDVTTYGARPDDNLDDTAAVQKAIDAARDQGLVAFFPGGIYLISETLSVMQRVRHEGDRGRWFHNRREANALIGSTIGKRPVFKLAPDAKGFADANKPRPLVWIWSQSRIDGKRGSANPEDEQPNISFNQVFKGIDIDVRGSGNAGAVGIRHAGSQGSTLEDITVWALGAFAGIYNPPGQGGGTYKVTVEGGRYGLWADNRARYPVLAGVVLKDQEEEAIHWRGQSNLTLAGFLIERSVPGSVIRSQKGGKAHSRSLTLVDGIIRGKGGLALDNREGRSVYLKDVRITGYTSAIQSGVRPSIDLSGSTATLAEYGYTSQGSQSIVGGQVREAGFECVTFGQPGEAPPIEDVLARHLWGASFPSFEDRDAVSVVDFGARGDDEIDDTEAFRAALAKHRKVFVPKGSYLLSETLVLAPDRHLLGVAKHLSILQASPGWKGAAGKAVVSTEDSAAASTTISFLMITRPTGRPDLPLLEWRAGRGSVVRGLMGGLNATSEEPSRHGTSLAPGGTFIIRGSGGGRWYGLAAEWNRMSPDTRTAGYRHLAIEGTEEPLAMYGLNIERGLTDPQMEIRKAANVAIYYLKGETVDGSDGRAGVLQINDSRNVGVFGYSGNARPWRRSVVGISDSKDLVLANVTPVAPEDTFNTVTVKDGSTSLSINGRFPATIVRLGDFRLQ